MPYIGKAPSSGIRSRFIYTATAAQTTFTGADGTGKTLGYTDGEYVDVYLNGVLLDPADYTATSKTSVVLDSGATVSDIVEIVVYDTFSVFNGTFTGDLTVDGDTLFVDSTNNRVGIGTVSPSSILHLSASNDPIITLTDTGFGASADITGSNGNLRLNSQTATIFDMADSEVIRIDSSGNLLVGKTSNSSAVAGAMLFNDGRVFGTKDGNYCAQFNRLSSDGEIIQFRKDGTTVGSIGSFASGNRLYFAGGNSALTVLTNEIYPATNTGAASDNTIQLGSSGARFSDLYLGGNLYLGGTGSANALDDYEEGTFTPTYLGSSSNPTVTYNSQTAGSYVKIGRQVIAKIVLRTDSVSGGSGNLYIGGLPFAASAASGTRAGTLNVGYSSSFVTENPQAGYISGGSTFVILSTNSDVDDSR